MIQRVRNVLTLCLLGVSVLSLSSCKGFTPEGTYQGNYFYSSVDQPYFDPVKIEIQAMSSSQFRVELKNLIDQKVGGFLIKLKSSREVAIVLPELKNLEISLSQSQASLSIPIQAQLLSKKELCYFGNGDDFQKIQLCFNAELFHLVVSKDEKVLWSLSGRKFKHVSTLELEPPRTLTLKEALNYAFHQGFEFNFSIQRLLQAKHTTHAAWLNLIPSLGTALVWNAEPGYVSAIATAQALTPFLLPSKWLKAKQASRESRAIQAAQWIVQSNIAAQVEQLSYALDRDANILKVYNEVLGKLNSWVSLNGVVVDSRPLSQEELAHVQGVIEWVSALRQTAEKVYREDQYGLSLALGFKNPEAVDRVIIEEERRSVEGLEFIEQKTLSSWGLQRSFELEQINYLISASEQRKKEIYFMWLDPTVDSSYNLGLQLIAQVNLAKAQQSELKTRRDETQARLLQEAYRVTSEWNQSVQQLRKHEHARIKKKRPEVALDHWLKVQLVQGELHADTLRAAVQTYLSNQLESSMDWASLHLAESKKNRILLAGSFERLLPKMRSESSILEGSVGCFGGCMD